MSNKSENNLSGKIAAEEGVSRKEIATDIAEQMHAKREAHGTHKDPDFPERVAKAEGLSRMEIKKDVAEQMPLNVKPAEAGMNTGVKALIVAAIAAVIGIVAWFMYH